MKKIILLFFWIPIIANAFTGKVEIDGIWYHIVTKGNSAEVISNTTIPGFYSGDIEIPSSVVYEGITCNVTSIGDKAFYNCPNLTSITIPSSIESISIAAFSLCI